MNEDDNNFSSRRSFLKSIGVLPCLTVLPIDNLNSIMETLLPISIPDIKDKIGNLLSDHEAMFYKKLPDQSVECHICPRQCHVAKQERGYCGTRANYDGTYYSLVYSRACTVHLDPIEKKPLFHFLPSKNALSLATAGCNMMCKFCQNWQISQVRPEQLENIIFSPEQIVSACVQKKIPAIAFTYSEPVIAYEYMFDTAKIGNTKNVKTVMISNGFIQKKPMQKLTKHLAAVKIDFKAFTEKFYWNTCRGHLKPVLNILKTLHDANIWFELVYLIVPTLNDDLNNIKNMSIWIKKNLGANVPLHFSRFFPQYQLKNIPPTPIQIMKNARKIAMNEGLNFVYLGNVPPDEGENTYCPNCHKILIKRHGYKVLEINLIVKSEKEALCRYCKTSIPGIWK